MACFLGLRPTTPTGADSMVPSASRLRKAGLSSLAGVAVAVSASVLPMTADASIIYSGTLNESIPISGGNVQINISGTSSGFQLSAGNDKGTQYMTLITISDDALVNDTSANQLINVGNGYSVGPVSPPPYYNISPNITASDFPATGGYFGFEMTPNSVTYYGYGQLAVSADSSTLTFVDYAYDDTGAPILTPAATGVPEPSSLAVMLVGMGAIGATLRRRRSDGRTAT